MTDTITPPRMDKKALQAMVGRGTPAEVAFALEALSVYLAHVNRENAELRDVLRPLAEHEAVNVGEAKVCAFCNADGTRFYGESPAVQHDADCAVLAARKTLGMEVARE